MVLLALLALVAGTLFGLLGADSQFITWISGHSEWILYLLMLSVGISIGQNRSVFSNIRKYHIRIFIIPFGIITGSILGGFVCCLLLQVPLQEGTVVASGLGWYSLSGILVTELISARVGSIAFLSSLMRELFSFFSIPWISRKFNYYTAIAPAAATSEDTTLPMLVKYTNEETVVMSVFNGIICSAMVPVLIRFFANLFG